MGVLSAFRSPLAAGFTLIELLVVTGIMTILSAVILFNNAKFGGVITLRNLAYDVALTIREAQTYGISVRRFGTGAGAFGSGYGVRFVQATPAEYFMFADVDFDAGGATHPDGHYNGADELVDSFKIGRGFRISDLCATPNGGTKVCGQDTLDVVFRRPEPDAEVRANDLALLNERAEIVLLSPRGDTISVLVEATGQISIQSNATPTP